MNNQDYEQKKKKCWEEYLAFNDEEYSKSAFSYAFDRAYALGKQTETITQEEIEKVANEFADREYEIGEVDWEALHKGYYHGMKDALGKQEKDADTVIQGWVARDCDGDVFLYQNEPDRNEIAWNGYMMHSLPIDSFPDLTWNSGPIEVELIIKRKKK